MRGSMWPGRDRARCPGLWEAMRAAGEEALVPEVESSLPCLKATVHCGGRAAGGHLPGPRTYAVRPVAARSVSLPNKRTLPLIPLNVRPGSLRSANLTLRVFAERYKEEEMKNSTVHLQNPALSQRRERARDGDVRATVSQRVSRGDRGGPPTPRRRSLRTA
ncbi:hypothetical protein AAFF_G00147050 [Aldrovandia affinis]|uniref:Uncharacterized protein n=1 Tax=Aldrovandia affinis TaxID=143900 RepID=A0AAD7RQ43_9TELE|nr:hypothetical protein AAFF_G00147050 [Aldrovandia affinis]